MPIQYNTTRQDTLSRWQITILHCPALYPSPASSFSLPPSLSLFLSPSLYLSQPQSRRTLAPAPAPAPAPMILHMMQSSLHDGTLSMHAFLLLLLLLLLLFLLLLGHFDWMFLPLPLSRFASLRFAPLRCVSFLLVWFRLASPRLASLRLYYWSASLGLAMITFGSLLFSISYSIPLYSIPPYSCSDSVIVYHTAYCNGLAQLIYWPADKHTDIETDRAWHDMMWCDVVIYSTLHLHRPDLTWPMLRYLTWPYLTFPLYDALRYCTQSYWTWPEVNGDDTIRCNMIWYDMIWFKRPELNWTEVEWLPLILSCPVAHRINTSGTKADLTSPHLTSSSLVLSCLVFFTLLFSPLLNSYMI